MKDNKNLKYSTQQHWTKMKEQNTLNSLNRN